MDEHAAHHIAATLDADDDSSGGADHDGHDGLWLYDGHGGYWLHDDSDDYDFWW